MYILLNSIKKCKRIFFVTTHNVTFLEPMVNYLWALPTYSTRRIFSYGYKVHA